MRKLFILLLLSLFVIPVLVADVPSKNDLYYNGFIELTSSFSTHDTLAATDSLVLYTTEFEGLSLDTLAWGIWLLAAETGAQANNLDVDLIFSIDSSSGFSAYQALKANLDVGATCPDQWYHFGLGANVDELTQMKWVGIIINNADSDANSLVIKHFGIALKRRD